MLQLISNCSVVSCNFFFRLDFLILPSFSLFYLLFVIVSFIQSKIAFILVVFVWFRILFLHSFDNLISTDFFPAYLLPSTTYHLLFPSTSFSPTFSPSSFILFLILLYPPPYPSSSSFILLLISFILFYFVLPVDFVRHQQLSMQTKRV